MRREILNEVKIIAFVTLAGMAVFASMLLFGLRAKAATVRDGVHSPAYAALQTVDRGELADMRNAEEWVEPLPYSQWELDLLAALVWAEAGDQDFIGQRIVADCVCNRASDRHPEWPNSIEAVIYQSGQFSVVANGRLDAGFYNATPNNYEAARLALCGDHYDTQVIYFSMYYCANGSFAYQHGDHFIGY